MPKEEWWLFYETFLKKADQERKVQRKNLVLYGTPANVEGAGTWTAYTSEGALEFEGLSLDSYIDREIQVWVRGTDIIRVEKEISDKVVYKNAWLVPADGKMEVYIGDIMRSFPLESAVKEETGGVLADVSSQGERLRSSL